MTGTEFITQTVEDNNTLFIYGVQWYGQTFLMDATRTIVDKIIVKLCWSGDAKPSGNVVMNIYAVDVNHKPTGNVLQTTSIPCSSLPTNGLSFSEYSFEFSSSATLATNTEYAMVINAVDGDSTHRVGWRRKGSNIYADGNYVESFDSGSTWGVDLDTDYYFRVFGYELSTIGPFPTYFKP